MKKFFVFLNLFILCVAYINAQIIESPVFDRTDVPAFRIEKVEITHDTTYVHCSYQAEEHSWASLSDKTYLESVKGEKRYPILKVCGIPFSPDRKTFENDTLISISLCFPKINFSDFNLIEDKNDNGFNIYGININKTYSTKYSFEQYESCGLKAYQLDSLGHGNEAIEYKKRQLEIAQYLYGIQSYECAAVLYDLCLYSTSDIESAILYGEQAFQILDTIPQTDIVKEDVARICGSLMSLYVVGKKDYVKGFGFGEKSLSIRRKVYKRDSPDYINFLVRLIQMYSQAGHASSAAFHSKELQEIYKEVSNTDPDYICSYMHSILNSGDYYIQADNIEEAKKCAEEASIMMREGKCNKPETQFRVYNLLAMSNEDVNKAIDYYKKAQEIAIGNRDIEPQRYAQSLRLLGNLYAKIKRDTINAITCYEKAVEVLKNEDNNLYLAQLAQLYDALGFIYYKKDNVKSQAYFERYMQIVGDLYGKESIMYGDALQYKSVREFWSYLKSKDNKDVLVSDVYNSSNIIKRYLDMAMLVSSNEGRFQLWQEYRELFDWWIPNVTFFLDSAEMNSLAFDASLFYKGYMMDMDHEMKMQLLENESEDVKLAYSHYLSQINALEKITASNSKEYYNTDSLKRAIAEDELYLTRVIFNSGFKFKKANLSWIDIQNNLNDKDIVIEFISFNGINKKDGSEYYIALVLNKKLSSPKMIRLFEKSELVSLINELKPDYKKISELIWNKDLLSELDGYENIYFSPAGCLNSIGIEYLPIPDSESIYLKYNMYRLSTSKELYNRNNQFKVQKSVLYGDLDYNWEKGEKMIDTYRRSNHIVSVSRAYADSLSSRGGFDILSNTKEEISGISKVLTNSGIVNEVFSGERGTEESFKNLSGKDINIIHLATHGLYVSQTEALQKKTEQNFVFISSDEGSNAAKNDMSLTRSALVMSGGNKLLRRDSINLGEEDEILTALEISNLKFNKLDLVVLSACQTALGDVDSEGVYGLQRGFKKAGANTILMSLDKVDDEATKILMVEFYRNLMKGKTKRQSLQDAQQYLRKVDDGKYDDPKYWASFIMLDGLE